MGNVDVLLLFWMIRVLEHKIYVIQITFIVTEEASWSSRENITYLEALILT